MAVQSRSSTHPSIVPTVARGDVQRRRREVALTATWLRQLRGASGAPATLAGAKAAGTRRTTTG